MLQRSVRLAALLLMIPGAAFGAGPHVARPSLPIKGASAVDTRGVVFFLKLPDGRNVAVGTAHTFALAEIARAGRTDFYSGVSLKKVGSSSRFLAEPGRPFNLPGATLRDDFLIYALDAAPTGVAFLQADPTPVKIGERVSLLGIPERGRRDEDDVFGTVAVVAAEKLEIDLDLAEALRGWGGAPILRANGKVIGIVQAHVTQGGTSRIFAAPIAGVLAAGARPLEKGKGTAFAKFADKAAAQPKAPAGPARAPDPRRAGSKAPVLNASGEPTSVIVDFEYPPPGSVVGGSACGVFVAGGAQASSGAARNFDVAIVLDTSRSTMDPTGADINGTA